MFKRILSFALVLALCVGAVPAMAAETQPPVTLQENIGVSGDSSFGDMLAAEIEDELADQQENNGYRLFSLEISGTTAAVQLEAVEDCTLVVGIYTEDGREMLASGWRDIAAGEREVSVALETQEMPTYFLAKAFLVNGATAPLCPAYTTPNYTEEMQEFFSKTVGDFDSDRVLNLDDDPQNNFAVFKESVKRVDTNGKNALTVNGGQYIFENADDTVKGLTAGDIFACSHDGDTLIVAVDTVQVSGDTVTVTEAKAELRDVFDYVRLEGQTGMGETAVVEENCPEGVIFEGLEAPAARARTVDIGGKANLSAKFTLAKKEVQGKHGKVTLGGTLNFGATADIKLYMTETYNSLSVKIDLSVKLTVSIGGTLDLIKLPLGVTLGISPVPGLYIEIAPAFVVSISAKAEVSGTLKGTVGFECNSDEGMKNTSSTPTFEAEVKGEITFFVGFSLEPRVKVISEKVAKVGIEATLGVEVKGTLSLKTKPSSSSVHECKTCLDGDISGKLTLKFTASFTEYEGWSFELTLREITVKIADFYWSMDKGEFGWGTCPYISYKVEATVRYPGSYWVNGADVTFDSPAFAAQNVKSEGEGVATAYLPNGTYTITATDPETGIVGVLQEVKVKDKARKVTVKLGETGIDRGLNDGVDSGVLEGLPIRQVVAGGAITAVVTADGDLYLWGCNNGGQLGNGTEERCALPHLVMGGVKSVALGADCVAAIKENGDLYTWGGNWSGQLGNGDGMNDCHTPTKIMEKVAAVYMSGASAAAITEQGELYTWGDNGCGQLGVGDRESRDEPTFVMEGVRHAAISASLAAAVTADGVMYLWGEHQPDAFELEYVTVPRQVMTDVKKVAVGSGTVAALTVDDELYTWGDNRWGQAGHGRVDMSDEHFYEPKKLMDNVADMCMGSHAGAVTNDGLLYLWGYNYDGQVDMEVYEAHTPYLIAAEMAAVSTGGNHTVAVSTDGALYLWGGNNEGQLGIGTVTAREPKNRVILSASGMEKDVPLAADVTPGETVHFSGLAPHTEYNFYVMRSREVNDLFAAENLLFIDQGVADEQGALSFTYRGDKRGVCVFVSRLYVPDEEPAGVLGDVDGDESITSTDARMTLQFYAGKIGEDKLNTALADVDGDGSITSTDARLILQKYAGKIKDFPAA